MYKSVPKVNDVIRVSDGFYIPINPDNRHWQAYQKWLAEGNTPEPADEKRP